jgi:hypothetical protein
MNSKKTTLYPFANRPFGIFRMTECLLLSLTLITLSACSTSANRNFSSTTLPEQSKIYLEPFSKYDNVSPETIDVGTLISRNLTEQLAIENRLQVATGTESLTLHGTILFYHDAVLDVQAELYDGNEFLAYSRVKRQINPPEQMVEAIGLITEQLLDELMAKMRDQPNNHYSEYYQPDRNNKRSGDPNNDSYYQHWGWWRHRQDKPGDNTEKHWDADTKSESLPRSGRVAADVSAKQAELAKNADASNETSTVLTVLGVIGVALVFLLAAALADSGDSKSHCRKEHHHCSPTRNY